MSGFPQSGKTTFAFNLIKALDNKWVLHINPKDYLPEDYQDLSHGDKSEWNISAWEYAIEKAELSLKKLPNQALIILDTSASKFEPLEPLIKLAAKSNHYSLGVFVDAPLKLRSEWGDDPDLLESINSNYAEHFGQSLLKYKKTLNDFLIVPNKTKNIFEDFDKNVKKIVEIINNIRNN